MDHDLLVDPILTWRSQAGQKRKTTLPGAISLVASGQLGDFPRLRAHQFQPWCMFITQLAAIALRRGGRGDPRLTEDEWRQLLLELTGGAHEAWCVVVDDLARPAFFQPPVPEGTLDGWSTSEHPDDIDILVTAKAHDVKTGLIASEDMEAWVYALVSLQTMQGYPGRGYNGISRMKRGYGNRPRVGCMPDLTIGARFLRDVAVLLDTWDILVQQRGFRDDGLGLVWTRPWDGTTSLTFCELAPHFIELCWRVRFPAEKRIHCAYTTTRHRRCLPEVEDGDVGDPWIPIERGVGALTVGSRGFDYRLVARLLFENDFEPAAAQRLKHADGDPVLFTASALARGQGRTEGLHERTISIAGAARSRLWHPDSRAALGRRAQDWIANADKMGRKVLFPALMRIAPGDTPPQDTFSAHVDEVFFDYLFGTVEAPEDEARLGFTAEIRDIAWNELQRAIDRCAVPDAQRLKAITEAEGLFHRCLRRHFPDLVFAEAGQQGGAS